MNASSPTPIVRSSTQAGTRLAGALVSLVALAILSACGIDPDHVASTRSADAPAFVDGLVDVMLAPPSEDAQRRFLERMPAPDDLSERAVVNRHDPSTTDRIETWTYPGVMVEVYHAVEGARRIPMSVRVTAPSRPVDGLSVGMSARELTAALGSPSERGDDAWRFHFVDDPLSAPYEIVAGVDDGVVKSIVWRAYLD